jgi:hypothetical protein
MISAFLGEFKTVQGPHGCPTFLVRFVVDCVQFGGISASCGSAIPCWHQFSITLD